MTTILVVGDEMGTRELLSEILGNEGHVTEVAENAQHAREYRTDTTPDLVLLGIQMPDTDDVTLLKEQVSQGLLTTPVIVMSGHATIDTAVETTKISALDFLEEPIVLQKLLTAVEQDLLRSKEKPRSATPATTPVVGFAGAMPNAATAGTPAALERTDINDVPTRAAESGGMQFSFDMPLREARGLFERAYFEYHLQREGGGVTRVAEKTGLERTHLHRKLKQLDVELSRSKDEPAVRSLKCLEAFGDKTHILSYLPLFA